MQCACTDPTANPDPSTDPHPQTGTATFRAANAAEVRGRPALSYNIGVYTAPSGATTAFAGETIASATWNAINSDYATALGQIALPQLLTIPVVVTFSNGNTDNPIPIAPLPGFTRYRATALLFSNPSAVPTAGTVALYTAAGAGGTQVIGSTAITIASTVSGVNTNAQVINCSISGIALTGSVLYVRVLVSGSYTVSANLVLQSLS